MSYNKIRLLTDAFHSLFICDMLQNHNFLRVHWCYSGLCGIIVKRSLVILQVAGSNLGSSLPWASCSHASFFVTKQYNLLHSSVGKVTAGLDESNGSLPPGALVTCRLTACTPGSVPGQTLFNEYRRTLPLPYWCYKSNSKAQCSLPWLVVGK